METISIVIPVLNEEKVFQNQQQQLEKFLQAGHEVIIVDGGSKDHTYEIAQKMGCICIQTKPSRGYQLHSGANISTNDILVFLHIDTILPDTAMQLIQNTLAEKRHQWGRFNITFTNKKPAFKVIAWFMNKRSCITSMITGDHTLFVKRELYFKSGGFKDIPIMEDISFSKTLKKYSRPVCLNDYAITSSRKWEKNGILKTVFLMWKLRLYYFFGMPTEKLTKMYYKK